MPFKRDSSGRARWRDDRDGRCVATITKQRSGYTWTVHNDQKLMRKGRVPSYGAAQQVALHSLRSCLIKHR